MIYLIDSQSSHSKMMEVIICEHCDEPIHTICISDNATIEYLYSTIESIIPHLGHNDIIFCPWAVPYNAELDGLFEQISEICWVVVAAGNSSSDIDKFTPAGNRSVITIGALNKSGNMATLSNYSNTKKLKWVPGTNYLYSGKLESGTSVSSAIYTAFLSVALGNGNFGLVDELIYQYKQKVLSELG